MRWIVEGADLNTGNETTTVIEAETAEEAEQKALARCILVCGVTRAPSASVPPPDRPQPAPRAQPASGPAPAVRAGHAPRPEPPPRAQPAARAESVPRPDPPPRRESSPRPDSARPAPTARRVVRAVRRTLQSPPATFVQQGGAPEAQVSPGPEAAPQTPRATPESPRPAAARVPLTVPADDLTPFDPFKLGPIVPRPKYQELERAAGSLRRLTSVVAASAWLSLLAGAACLFAAAVVRDDHAGVALAGLTPFTLGAVGAAALAYGLLSLLAAAFARMAAAAGLALRDLARNSLRK